MSNRKFLIEFYSIQHYGIPSRTLIAKAPTNFRKYLLDTALPLAKSAMNIKLAAAAATVSIVNEPICNENEETLVTKAVIRTSRHGVLFLELARN